MNNPEEKKQDLFLQKQQIDINLDEQISNNSQRIKQPTIESLIFFQKSTDRYQINDEGASNRRRLFSTNEQTNLFSLQKSDSIDHSPKEIFDRQLDFNQQDHDKTIKEQDFNEDEDLGYTASKFQKIPLQEDDIVEISRVNESQQQEASIQNNTSNCSHLLQLRDYQKSDQFRKNIDVCSPNYKYSQHMNYSPYNQSSLYHIDADENSRLAHPRSKNNRKDSFFHSMFVKESTFNNNNNNNEGNNNGNLTYKNHLVSLTYLKKFVKQLLLRVAYQDYRILQKKQLQIINDKSIIDLNYIEKMHGYSEEENVDIIHRRNNILLHKNGSKHGKFFELKQKIFNFFHNTFYIFWKRTKALEPSALAIIIWEMFFLFLLIGQLILIPIKGCFNQINLEADYWSYILYKVPIFCFVFDIIVGFHTGYYEFGMPIMDKRRIAINYIQRKFWIDFCCTVLLSFNLSFRSDIVDFIAMFLRINQMKIKVNKIDQRFQLSYKYSLFTQILRLIILIIFLAHLTGCGFHLIGEYTDSIVTVSQPKSGMQYVYRSWIHQQGLQDKDWITRYVSSIYFSIISMITIGFGDITPINTYEKIYVIGITFISCGTFAYCINTIGSIFAQRDQKQKDFEQNQYQLQSYLDYMQSSQETQIRVLKYFEYLNELSDEAIIKGSQIFDGCSSDLKEEVICDRNMKIILSINILRNSFSKEFLKIISLKMQEKRFGPGETILHEKQIPQHLTIIAKGDIEHYYQNKSFKQTLDLNQSRALELKQFFTEEPTQSALRAKNVVTVIQISFSQFIECLKEFQQDYEKFCMIRDQMIFDNRHVDQCYSCQQYGHSLQDCPQIHFHVQSIQFAKKVFHSNIHEKRQMFTRKRKRMNSISNKIHVTLSLKMRRWEIISQMYPDYFDINIKQELNIKEKDKYFFKRCPKIKLGSNAFQQLSQQKINNLPTNQITSQYQIQYDQYNEKSKNILSDSFSSSDYSESLTESSDEGSVSINCNNNNNNPSINGSSKNRVSNGNQNEMNITTNIGNNNIPMNINSVPNNNFISSKQQESLHDLSQGTIEKKKKQNSSNYFENEHSIITKDMEDLIQLQQSYQQQQFINTQNTKAFLFQNSKKQYSNNPDSPQWYSDSKTHTLTLLKNQSNNDYQQQTYQEVESPLVPSQLTNYLTSIIEPTSRGSEINPRKVPNESERKQMLIAYEQQNTISDEMLNNDNLILQKKLMDHLNYIKNQNQQTSLFSQEERNQEEMKEIKLRRKQKSSTNISKRLSSKTKHGLIENEIHQHRRPSIKNHMDRPALTLNKNYSQKNNQFMELPKQSVKSLSSINESKSQYTGGGKIAQKDQEGYGGNSPDQVLNNQHLPNYIIEQLLNNEKHFFGKIGLRFEKMKEYLIYYPKNNLSNVIKSHKKIVQKNQQQQNKSKFGLQEKKTNQPYKNKQNGNKSYHKTLVAIHD